MKCKTEGCFSSATHRGLCNRCKQRKERGGVSVRAIVDVNADGSFLLECGHSVFRRRHPVRKVVCEHCDPEAYARSVAKTGAGLRGAAA